MVSVLGLTWFGRKASLQTVCVSSLLNILYLRRERDPDGLTISGLAFSSSVKRLTVILTPADSNPCHQGTEHIASPPSRVCEGGSPV